MRRICPRRSGLEWQESMWNRLKPGKANDERRQSLSASRSCRPKERNAKRPHASIAKLPDKLTLHRKMHRIYRAAEHPITGMFLERLEPCEGKLSRHGS